MRRRNYYAVRVGQAPGIYSTWSQFQESIRGVPNPVYKGFDSLEAAKEYMEEGEGGDALVAYTAGVRDKDGMYGWGLALVQLGADESRSRGFCGQASEAGSEGMGDAVGEFEAAVRAMRYAVEHGHRDLILEYSLPQVREWAETGVTNDDPIIRQYAEEAAQMQEKGLHVFYKRMNSTGWGSRKAVNLARRGLAGESFETTGGGVSLPKIIARKQDMPHIPVPPGPARTQLERTIVRAMIRAAALYDLVDGRDAAEVDSLTNRAIGLISQEPTLQEHAQSEDLKAEAMRSANAAYEKHVLASGMMEEIVPDEEAEPEAEPAPPVPEIVVEPVQAEPEPVAQPEEPKIPDDETPEDAYERVFQKVVGRLRSERMEQKVSQQAAAAASGVDRNTISKMELGQYGMRADTFRRYAAGLGILDMPEIDALEELEGQVSSVFLKMLRY